MFREIWKDIFLLADAKSRKGQAFDILLENSYCFPSTAEYVAVNLPWGHLLSPTRLSLISVSDMPENSSGGCIRWLPPLSGIGTHESRVNTWQWAEEM